MKIDERIDTIKSLIAKREELDRQINAFFGGAPASKKPTRCSRCGQEGHNAKSCQATVPVDDAQGS